MSRPLDNGEPLNMTVNTPRRTFGRPSRRGNTQLITAVVIVLVAVVGVLLFVNPSPKSALNSGSNTTPAANSTTETTPSQRANPSTPNESQPVAPTPKPVTPTPMSGPPDLAGNNSGSTTQPEESPLVIEPAQFDYGYVLVGETKTQQVVVSNPSNRTINITDLQSACPCTVAEISPRAIGPGQSAVLSLTYTAQTFPHVAGLRSVRLLSREYPRHSPEVRFVATVGREIRVNPGGDPVISQQTGEITLASYDGQPFHVLLVDGREPEFVDFDPETEQPRSEYLVRYDLTARADGSLPRHLHILTDRASDPMTEIVTRFSQNFREPLNADPPYWMAENRIVHVGILNSGESSVRREVKVLRMPPGSDDSDMSVGIRPATGRSTIGGNPDRQPDSPAAVGVQLISVEQAPDKDRNRIVTLEFTLNTDTPPGFYHDILSFILSDGSYTELDVATYVGSDG